MRRLLAVAATVAVAAVALPACVSAQASPVTLSLGVGGAWAGTTCTGCIATHENGSSGLAQLAVHVRPSLRLGVEIATWRRVQFGEPGRLDYTMAVAEYYPAAGSPFYVKSNVGYGRMRYHVRDVYGGPPDVAEQGGLAYGIGAGYDLPVSRRATLAPFAQIVHSLPAGGRLGEFPVENQTFGMIEYGLALRLR